MVCGHCPVTVTLSLTNNETVKMAVIAVMGILSYYGGDNVAIGKKNLLPVSNKLDCFCGR